MKSLFLAFVFLLSLTVSAQTQQQLDSYILEGRFIESTEVLPSNGIISGIKYNITIPAHYYGYQWEEAYFVQVLCADERFDTIASGVSNGTWARTEPFFTDGGSYFSRAITIYDAFNSKGKCILWRAFRCKTPSLNWTPWHYQPFFYGYGGSCSYPYWQTVTPPYYL